MRTLIFIAALFMCATTAKAQTSITKIIETIPREIIPYINDNSREEISKFTDENDSLSVKNELNGNTTIRKRNDDYVRIDLNESSSLQIKLLPVNDTTQIICMVRTMKSPLPESEIAFYSTEWEKLENGYGLPDIHNADSIMAGFTCKPDTMTETKFEELRKYIEPIMVYAGFDDKGQALTFSINIPFTTKDMRNEVKAIIKQKSFKWSNGFFKEC